MAISKYELRKAMKDAGIVFDGAKDFITEGMAVDAAIPTHLCTLPRVPLNIRRKPLRNIIRLAARISAAHSCRITAAQIIFWMQSTCTLG